MSLDDGAPNSGGLRSRRANTVGTERKWRDNGEPPDLPSGGHAELPGGGQRNYLV
jgi:hypothetical protein